MSLPERYISFAPIILFFFPTGGLQPPQHPRPVRWWTLGEHQDSRENKTNRFPEGPDVKCFVIFLDFHFNSNKRITAANQNSRLGTYINTNLILKTTEWMIYKVLFLYYLHLFPPLAAVSLLGWLWKSLLFSLGLCVCVVDCWLLRTFTKRKLATFFPPPVTPLSTMLWSRAVMNPVQGTIRLKYITIGIHLILVKAMWPRINQWLSLFSWVKV